MPKKKSFELEATEPYMVSEASSSQPITTARRNAASVIERTDRFRNIEDGLVPFKTTSAYGVSSSVDVRDAVILCQKCYYNFAIFRNVIDLMTEFSVNNIFFRGGSEKSKLFFTALFNKINMIDLQDRFFREYYRSGNVFIYRFDTKIQPSEVMSITQTFAADMPVEPYSIPSRYIILNPADIQMTGTANFAWGYYFKILNEYEISILKNPKTEEDIEVYQSLPDQTKKDIAKGNRAVILPLDPMKISMVFYKKQDYEPFAVPMGYPVLESINAKEEMKKIDMAIARTAQKIILLVTNGNEPAKHGINPKNLELFRGLFQNQSVNQTLVADYTTDAKFIVPEIGNLLDPKKYEILERDINMGLNNVFAGGEKFANQAQKVELFVARLEQGRKAFINNFLLPEIKRIALSVGFKNFPTPYFEDIELKDNTNFAKIYARLVEIGVLTPEQGFKAIETNTLPDPSTMEEDQKAYKKARDGGLYMPLIGGPKDDAGSPTGPKAAPKSVGPIGTKASEDKFGLLKLKSQFIAAQNLEEKVIDRLKSKKGIKRLTKHQREGAAALVQIIISNEEPDKWVDSIDTYIDNPEDRNIERVNKVLEIASARQLDPYVASLMLASQVDEAV